MEVLKLFIALGLYTALSGGPLPPGNDYELAEICFHWGKTNARGSEHTVNGKAFPMEVSMI